MLYMHSKLLCLFAANLSEEDSLSDSSDEDFSFIRPTLTKQLRNILQKYPDNGQIIKVSYNKLKAHFHFILKSHAIHCLKFAWERSQISRERSQCDFELFAMFDFLRAFACELLPQIEGSQLGSNFAKQRDKGGTCYQKETDLIG